MARVILLSRTWRLVTATLMAVSWVTLPTYLVAIFLLPPVPPIVMVRSFVLGTALPWIMAWAIARGFAGSAAVRNGVLHLRRSDLELEVPCAAIAAVRPWRLSLPCPGLSFRLRADGRVPFGVGIDHPTELLDALTSCGIDTTTARRDPSVIHAGTRRRRRWYGPIVKFVLLGVLPASLLFYTHQHIAYGGTFGQYYLESPRAYFATFAEYWATTAILLVSYASVWRAAGEAVVWTVAVAARSRAHTARRVVDVVCALAYYAGVPAMLALRYLAG